MMTSLRVEFFYIHWVITAFSIARTVTIPALGWLSGRFGPRTLYLVSQALFTIGLLGSAPHSRRPHRTTLGPLHGPNPFTPLATLAIASLLEEVVLLRKAKDASVVALALEATQGCVCRYFFSRPTLRLFRS